MNKYFSDCNFIAYKLYRSNAMSWESNLYLMNITVCHDCNKCRACWLKFGYSVDSTLMKAYGLNQQCVVLPKKYTKTTVNYLLKNEAKWIQTSQHLQKASRLANWPPRPQNCFWAVYENIHQEEADCTNSEFTICSVMVAMVQKTTKMAVISRWL